MSDESTLLNRLRELMLAKAYMRGDFILTSGKRSDHYFDCKRVTLDPEGLAVSAELLTLKLRQAGIGALGGLVIGADPIVAGVVAVSRSLGHPVTGFLIRKESKGHGTRKRVEGPVETGSRVAIVDDVITSGGSVIAAIETAREEGLEPVVAYALVDREEGGEANITATGVPFQPLLKYSSLFA